MLGMDFQLRSHRRPTLVVVLLRNAPKGPNRFTAVSDPVAPLAYAVNPCRRLAETVYSGHLVDCGEFTPQSQAPFHNSCLPANASRRDPSRVRSKW